MQNPTSLCCLYNVIGYEEVAMAGDDQLSGRGDAAGRGWWRRIPGLDSAPWWQRALSGLGYLAVGLLLLTALLPDLSIMAVAGLLVLALLMVATNAGGFRA